MNRGPIVPFAIVLSCACTVSALAQTSSARCELSMDRKVVRLFADINSNTSLDCTVNCKLIDSAGAEIEYQCTLNNITPGEDGVACEGKIGSFPGVRVMSSIRACQST